ncbi:MAG: aminotransferase class IV [Acidobacteria bacterium]|nr:aminotransferase class IV [Acidobacteriota bacterium]
MHRFLLHNDNVRDTTEHLLTPGQVGLLNGWGVFSTLRVFEGSLYAYPRHWARMKRDAELLHVPFPESPDWLKERLLRLVAANSAQDSTLRVAVVRNKGGMFESPGLATEFDLIAFTKDLKDWGTSARLALAPKTRHADHVFAGTKMLSWSFNLVLLEEATLLPADLEKADEVFMTSSTRDLLPVAEIEALSLRPAGASQGVQARLLNAFRATFGKL